MKIEVGDTVNTAHHKNVVIKRIEMKRHVPVVIFDTYKGVEVGGWLTNCALVKKGEKKMKVYKGFEVIEKMHQGGILQLTGDRDEAVYKIEGNFIGEKNKGDKHWVVSDMTLNYFLKNEFTEYKEPLKYKIGDEVWVKAKVIEVDESDTDGLVYEVSGIGWKTEEELKGINE